MFNAETMRDEIIQWIQDIFTDNGPECCAVIGISGGKDSSITAALCARALGKTRVYGVLLPCGEEKDMGIARDFVHYLDIPHCVINIGGGTDTIIEAIQTGGLTPNRAASVNTPARIRMTVLYAVSAIMNGRVANTCNLSEDWVGYATKFGDGAGDFSPLAHLTVTETKAVGQALGLPERFVDKVPEDGLTGLTDEENLGFSYVMLDRYIREGICEDPIIQAKIDQLHKAALHKLKPVPSMNTVPFFRGRSEPRT